MAYNSPDTCATPPATMENEEKRRSPLDPNEAMRGHPGTDIETLATMRQGWVPGKETPVDECKTGSKKPGDKTARKQAMSKNMGV